MKLKSLLKLFLFFFCLNTMQLNAQTTLIYVGDPMCSWCYGFAPEVSKIKQQYPEFDFKIILGGLRPHGTETMEKLGDFLSHHWKEVNKRSGQPFSYGILNNKSFRYDTEPSCRAVVAVRLMDPALELSYFKEIQKAFYVDNLNTNLDETFIQLAENLGLDKEKFKQLFTSIEIKDKTRLDFENASQMGVTGFPALLLMHDNQLYAIAKGYDTAEHLSKRINKITTNSK